MCWSLEVTAAFAVLETLCLVYIWKRNDYHDRANAIGHLPIVGQEIIQVGLWMVIEPSTDTAEVCSPTNRILSIMCMALIHTVPWFFNQRNRALAASNENTSFWMKRLVAAQMLHHSAFQAYIISGCLLLMLSGVWVSCTTVGPHGHQIWPLIMTPDPTPRWFADIYTYLGIPAVPVIRLISWGIYAGNAGNAVDSSPGKDLAQTALTFVGPWFIVAAMWFRGYEWGSIWCHLASMLCVLYLVTPAFYRATKDGRHQWFPYVVESQFEHYYGWREEPVRSKLAPGSFGADANLLTDPSISTGSHAKMLKLPKRYQPSYDLLWGAGTHDVTAKLENLKFQRPPLSKLEKLENKVAELENRNARLEEENAGLKASIGGQ